MIRPDWDQPVEIQLHDLLQFDVYTNWGQKTVGFGQLWLRVKLHKENGKAVMRIDGDMETMSREWVRKALHAMVDTVANELPEHHGMLPVDVPIPQAVLAHWDKINRMAGGE